MGGRSALYGPGVGVEEADEFGFAAAAVAVADGVEGWGVAGFGEVGEFVEDYVVAELGGEEYVEVGEADAALAGVAGAEYGAAVGYLPAVDAEAEGCGELAGAGKEELGGDVAADGLDLAVDEGLDFGGGEVEPGWDEDGEAVGGAGGADEDAEVGVGGGFDGDFEGGSFLGVGGSKGFRVFKVLRVFRERGGSGSRSWDGGWC